MRIRIEYTATIGPEDLAMLTEYARHLGMGHDNPGGRVLLKRLFRRYGESAWIEANEHQIRMEEKGAS